MPIFGGMLSALPVYLWCQASAALGGFVRCVDNEVIFCASFASVVYLVRRILDQVALDLISTPSLAVSPFLYDCNKASCSIAGNRAY
ncbi:hypothetical protein GGTG_04881 [Gaeumannomyces tritici R3-111a-1]|uniref:Secreted protein n=1 Tax=Gaeumannomyces tritici (strain R3-111a-1) TaxID=644352 RepID=J3NUC7_GAET3|nr:hypothetical protein GGTG_04881 [Gaeumannomyces tritici R3-111a-1]EJT79798.1 hypothetical protein GGTG_04881 [Gaeumannomyces tritici R3-111a-1]